MEPIQALAEFDVSADSSGDEPASYMWSYWRKPDGFIIVAPSWPTEYTKRVKQGWEALDQYGEFYLDKVKNVQSWSAHREPYRQIFARGGADAFTVAQIIEHNWDVQTPYKAFGVKFPQLDGVDIRRVKCNHCRASFVDGEPFGLTGAEERMERHVETQHKQKSSNDGLARAIAAANSEVSGGLAEVLQMMAKRMEQSDALMATVLREVQARPKAATPSKRKAPARG